MTRRKALREYEFTNGVAQLLVFIAFAAMWLPAVRPMLMSHGVFVIVGVVLVGLVACGVFLIRRSEKKPALDSTRFTNLQATAPRQVAERNVDWQALGVQRHQSTSHVSNKVPNKGAQNRVARPRIFSDTFTMTFTTKQLVSANSESAVSSVVEHYLDTVGVTGSNPVSRTIFLLAF